jgi:hypothetical protein
VTLDGIRPSIWRRIQVRRDITLFKLYKILQVVMGWQDYHLHQFVINGECYSVISIEADMLGDDFKAVAFDFDGMHFDEGLRVDMLA